MTSIVANINKSGSNQPLTGFIRVTALGLLDDPSVLYVRTPADFSLVSGSVTFDLEPSDIAKVSYKFEVYETVIVDAGTGETADRVVQTFEAQVPDSVNPINLTTLAQQSGLRYDLRDSSLLTLARYLSSQSAFTDYFESRLMSFKGEWFSITPYVKGSVVTYNGVAYIQKSTSISTNQRPDLSPTVWGVLSARGEQGIPGEIGSPNPLGTCVLWQAGNAIPNKWGLMPDSPITGDAFFIKYTGIDSSALKAFLKFDGTNGSTTITDEILGSGVWNVTGSPTLSSSQAYAGVSSLLITGDSNTSNRISAAFRPALDFPGDFEWSCWVYPTGITGLRQNILGNAIESFGNIQSGFVLYIQGGTVGLVANSGTAATRTGLVANVWQLVTATRTGNTLSVYLNGVKGVDGTFTGTGAQNAFNIGNSGYGAGAKQSYNFQGYIDLVTLK